LIVVQHRDAGSTTMPCGRGKSFRDHDASAQRSIQPAAHPGNDIHLEHTVLEIVASARHPGRSLVSPGTRH